MSRAGIEQYLYMMDRAFDGQDGWHSLLKNLGAVKDDEWGWVPDGAKRSIAELAEHCGARYMYENHMFGDRTMTWESVPAPPPRTDHAGMIEWVREGYRRLRAGVEALADDEELTKKRGAPWGNEAETRWLINIMIQHDLYHAGEINHLRAMRQGNDE
jgi:uncharacterized damage-inducible protein DinB